MTHTLIKGQVAWIFGGHVHPPFRADFDADVEAAMEWAEGFIGSRQDWRHSRDANGTHRWEATT
ncbi:hypothetical protein ACFPA8_27580 [Streptomyces ovatisporus]|uniref:Metallophosphoesterase n=1 Tax=Streptomyces ovatisporus TaxID=1128682 RepID=A0ABV9ADF0_9ACTN